MDYIYKNIEEYNPMLSNKKLNPIVTELFITGRKLNFSLVLIPQSYFAVPKNIRLSSTHYFVMKIPNKRELQQIAFSHSSDIDFQDFMNLYKKSLSPLGKAFEKQIKTIKDEGIKQVEALKALKPK